MPDFNHLLNQRERATRELAVYNQAVLEAFSDLPGCEVELTGTPFSIVRHNRNARKGRFFTATYPCTPPRVVSMLGLARAVEDFPSRLRVDYPESEEAQAALSQLVGYVFKIEDIVRLEVKSTIETQV